MVALPGQATPPAIAPAPAGVGPVSTPQGNPGNTQAALTKVRNALQMLEQALPDVPMGMPMHNDILSAVKNLSKHLAEGAENKGLDIQSLIQATKQTQQGAPMAAMQRMFAQQGSGAGTPPALPPAAGAAA